MNKYTEIYNQLKLMDKKYNIHIISVIFYDLDAPDRRISFDLGGEPTLDLIISHLYLELNKTDYYKEFRALMEKYNLEIFQFLISPNIRIINNK